MKNIIVPIDFSDESIKGLNVALLFAKKQHTNIQLVYVKKKSNDYRATSFSEEKAFAEKKFEALVSKHNPELLYDSTLRYIIKKGKIYQEVVNQAESYKDSLIAMSTHGASGFEELFIGSNASKIISATDLPVITVSKGKCPDNIKKIVLPIDISPKTRQKVSYTAELARVFNAELYVVSVTSSQSKKLKRRLELYTNQVCGYLKSLKLNVFKDELLGENLTDVTINYATGLKADIISIMTEQVANLNLFSGSYAQQMINKAPMLVLNITPKTMGYAGSFSTYGG